MPKELVGRFYFKQTGNGNLIGEYSNNMGDKIYTESCDLMKQDEKYKNEKFIGEYHSTRDENGKAIFVELKILPKFNGKGEKTKMYTLSWEFNDKKYFSGEGMLCDEILIGDYKLGEY